MSSIASLLIIIAEVDPDYSVFLNQHSTGCPDDKGIKVSSIATSNYLIFFD